MFIPKFLLGIILPIVFKPGIIVGLGGPPNLTPVRLASVIIRAKFIPIFVGDLQISFSAMPKPATDFFQLMLGACFRSSFAVLAISNMVKKELTTVYGIQANKVFVYKYKISSIFSTGVPKDLHNKLNPSGPIVLTVARMSEEKGLQYLVEAAQNVVFRIPNVKFVLHAYSAVPSYRTQILDLISARKLQKYFKIIEGFSKYEEMPKFMAAADVFVLPSLSEGLGMVILEAMACGVPVVATRVSGIPDIVVNNENGLLVEPMDSQGLANAIIYLLVNEKERQNLSKGALTSTHQAVDNEFESTLSKLIFRNRGL
jgi:glycosyltransferase involved in cell wall biosynthesis